MRRLLPSVIAAVILVGVVAGPASPADAAPIRESLITMIKALPVAAPSHVSNYNRTTEFGNWTYHSTAYGHCNTRALVLIQESKVATIRNSSCTVLSGRWYSIYNGQYYTNPYNGTYVQIDHLVPVENAWIMGAWAWTQARRVAFYNDLGDYRSLNAVDTKDNDSKGDKTPAAWMPPVGHCRYVEYWAAVKTRWGLKVASAEKIALLHYAAACGNPTMTITRA